MRCVVSQFGWWVRSILLGWTRGGGMGSGFWCGGRHPACRYGCWNGLVRLAAMNLLVGTAKRTEPLEGFDQPKGKAGLLAPCALAHDAVRAVLGQRSRSLGYGFVAHVSRVFD